MASATTISNLFMQPLKKMKPIEALKKAIEQNDEKILDLNRQQLDKGKDAKGKSLGKYKNFKYKNRFQPVDLKLTGEFRDKFTLAVDNKQTIIFSQDQKEAKLEKRYGKDIHGVPAELLPNMQEIIKDDFINELKKQML